MSSTTSLFIHGFNCDRDGWKEFLSPTPTWHDLSSIATKLINQTLPHFEVYERLINPLADPAFNTELVSWNSQKLGNKYYLGLKILLSDKAVDAVHNKWRLASEEAGDVGLELATHINRTVEVGGKLVISAHSLGACVAYHAVKNIRADIRIFMFIMAGAAEYYDYEYLIDDHENIKYLLNFYNTKDFALARMLPQMDFPVSPVGTVAISPAREGIALNFETSFGHSDYKNFRLRAKYVEFTHFVTRYCGD
jgi:hypothetical protein